MGQLAPALGAPEQNLRRIEGILESHPAEVAVFPELYLTGYRVGDRIHQFALREGDATFRRLADMGRAAKCAIVLGAPVASAQRPGEVHNAAVLVRPDGSSAVQVKRYLPTYGPFEEGTTFTPTDHSLPVELGGLRVGLEVCYDAFFPEVSRDLALQGSILLVVISAAPVTSRRLFEKVLPARAVENAAPLVYVNRVGVEDGLVFGGGTVALDARGDRVAGERSAPPGGTPEEFLELVDLDLTEAPRWRPFRPVLRDVATRPAG